MPQRIELSPEKLAEVRRLWDAGESQQEIAAAVGISVDAFRHRLKDQLAGLPKRSRTANSDRRGQDLTPEEIAVRAVEVRSRWPIERWLPEPVAEYGRLGRAAMDAAEHRG